MSAVDAPGPDVSPDLLDVVVASFGEVLHRPEVAPSDDFFDMGGDSLAAAALVMSLETLGIRLPVAALFDAPTPAALVCAIRDGGCLHPPCLVTLKPGDGQQAMFIAPGASGSVLELVRAARGIQTRRRVYGLQPRDDEGRKLTMDTIEQEAAFYLPLIRAAQPRGPYVLAGYSLGGMVALELAQTLVAAGETVEHLIIIDTLTPIGHFPAYAKLRFWLRRAAHHLAVTGTLPWRRLPPYLARRIAALARDFRPRVGQSRVDLSPGPAAPAVMDAPALMEHAVKVFLAYRPRYFPGPVAFVQSDSVGGKVHYPDLLWAALSRQVTIYRVKGGHYDMLSSNSNGVSAALSSALDRTAP